MTQHKHVQLEIFDQTARIKKESKVQKEHLDKIPDFKFPAQFCIKAACLIIVILISFAFGVERGKVISKKNVTSRVLAESKPRAITKQIAPKQKRIQKLPVENKKLEKKKKDDKLTSPGYIIQVASYNKNSSYIDKEIIKLQKDGYDTVTVSSGNYMGICAGKFKNKTEAQKHLKQLKRTYKDCFIRKI